MASSEFIDNLSIYFGARQAPVEFELKWQGESSCELPATAGGVNQHVAKCSIVSHTIRARSRQWWLCRSGLTVYLSSV